MNIGVATNELETTVPGDFPSKASPDQSAIPAADRSAVSIWGARAVIVAIACGMAWYTWGHWGDFQIDCGRELYVPAAILRGKLLFRDIWYMYGPLAPYLKALLFWIFGVNLDVLYGFGLALTIGTALVTFEIARQFDLGLVASVVPSLFFLSESFYPFIRNFIFPYSYAASLAAFLGSCCLYFVLRHASSMRAWHLGSAAILASLVILTKQEFGLACVTLLVFEIIAIYWTRRSAYEFWKNTGLCIAGLLPSLLIYGLFIWKVSPKVLFFENWVSTPGTYFMRNFGARTMADQGFRLVPAELLEVTEYTLLAMALWYVLAALNAFVIQKLELRSRRWMVAPVLLTVLPIALACVALLRRAPWGLVVNPLFLAQSLWESYGSLLAFASLTQLIFPAGIFLLVIVYLFYSAWKFLTAPAKTVATLEVVLGIYALLISFRQMMELEPTLYKCAVFFNVPAFLIFIILVQRVIRWAGRALDFKRREFLTAALLVAEAAFLFPLFFPRPKILPARLTTEYGSFYTSYDVAEVVPQIISFMRTHTKNGRDILVLPEPPSLYVFSGMLSPTRWHQLMPGVVPPDQEQEYISELESNQVQYILIGKRSVSEYGVAPFIEDGYNHGLYRWIMTNYARIGQFGAVHDRQPATSYFVSVYKKIDKGAVH